MSNTDIEAIDCQAVVRALWDYLDGRLPAAEMERIAGHLQGCLGCRSHAEFERTLLDQIGRTRREPEALASLETRIKLLLKL